MMTLQTIIAPQPRLCSPPELYYRAQGAVVRDPAEGSFTLGQGARLAFDTYFNLFNLGSWSRVCALNGLGLELRAIGHLELRLYHQSSAPSRLDPNRPSSNRPNSNRPDLASPPVAPPVLIHCSRQNLTQASPCRIDLTALLQGQQSGLIWLEIRALKPGLRFQGARVTCRNQLRSPPRLAIAITTYRRAHQVRDTVARLEQFLASFAFGDQIRVLVIDNGHSHGQGAGIPASARVRSYSNPNFGGAGGFARGLIEAQDQGFSHCLFMDDDAAFHMENIRRTYMLLALARDPATALAGAMISNRHTWKIWESGAYFDGSCHPLFNGTDLRQPAALRQMQLAPAQPQPETFYGGWWFFAFPLAGLRHHPFPFFVRGDDISFCLANDFAITTLNGVVSFQDDFVEKESPQTLYLDLRNHLLHHLVFDPLARSALGTARIACRFMMRSMLRCKYESAAAQLLAWRDVMQGPAFFDHNIDMQDRQAAIRALTRVEHWHRIDSPALPERRRFSRLPRRLRHILGLASLNGHLLPFWSRIGDHMVLDIDARGLVFPAFGGARLTYVSDDASRGYTLHHSKRRFFTLAWQMFTTLLRWLHQHGRLKRAYRRGYEEMTSRAYWDAKLKRPAPSEAASAAAAPARPDSAPVSAPAPRAETEPEPETAPAAKRAPKEGARRLSS